MRFFTLDRLAGPGHSLDENFELMNLALIQADLPQFETFRLAAPDGGLDLYSRDPTGEPGLAWQCKAYERYRPDLLKAVSQSIAAAVRSSTSYPWKVYYLVIPFVPTKAQREKLEKTLAECRKSHHIVDRDEIEASLFRSLTVAQRFFPNVEIHAYAPGESHLKLCSKPGAETADLTLRLRQRNVMVPVTVSRDEKCGSLLAYLIGRLKLPVRGFMNCMESQHGYDIRWEIRLEGSHGRVLDPEKTFRDEGVDAGAVISLWRTIKVTWTCQSMRGMGDWYVCLQTYFGAEEYKRAFFVSAGYQRPKRGAADHMFNYCIDHYLDKTGGLW